MIWPAYITATRSARPATMPRSWVISSTAMPQLVRVRIQPLDRIGDAYLLKQVQCTTSSFGSGNLEMRQNPLDDLFAHPEHRVEAGHRILKNHADPPAANSS